MTQKAFKELRKKVIEQLKKEKEKELYCHVQFVLKVGLELAREYRVDEQIIELSCLLHDIGRDFEVGTEDHGDAGERIARDILSSSDVPAAEARVILSSIKNHCKTLPEYTLEEKIVITADSASKVLYHEAFMLLCKKPTFKEKLQWGQKYLEKGYKNTLFPEYKSIIRPKYNSLKDTYQRIEGFSL